MRQNRERAVAGALAISVAFGGCTGGWGGGWFLAPVGHDEHTISHEAYGVYYGDRSCGISGGVEDLVILSAVLGVIIVVDAVRAIAQGCGDWLAECCSGA